MYYMCFHDDFNSPIVFSAQPINNIDVLYLHRIVSVRLSVSLNIQFRKQLSFSLYRNIKQPISKKIYYKLCRSHKTRRRATGWETLTETNSYQPFSTISAANLEKYLFKLPFRHSIQHVEQLFTGRLFNDSVSIE